MLGVVLLGMCGGGVGCAVMAVMCLGLWLECVWVCVCAGGYLCGVGGMGVRVDGIVMCDGVDGVW